MTWVPEYLGRPREQKEQVEDQESARTQALLLY
jgi:hypothetical protein